MSAILIRIVIAVIVVLVLFAILPSVLGIFELPKSGDLLRIIKIVIGGLALLYVIGGATVRGWFNTP